MRYVYWVFNATFNNISVTGLLWQLGNHSIWRKSWIFCKLLTNFIRYNFTSHVYIFIEIDLMGISTKGFSNYLPPNKVGDFLIHGLPTDVNLTFPYKSFLTPIFYRFTQCFNVPSLGVKNAQIEQPSFQGFWIIYI